MTIKVFADLRSPVPPESSYKLTDSDTVGDGLDSVGIPRTKAATIFVNGRHAQSGDRIRPGDTLSVFPLVGGG